MYMSAKTLDDLLRRVYEKLLQSKNRVPSTRGVATELTGILLHLTNPRARLSRTEVKGKLFSALGEVLWYFSKSNSLAFIEYYVSRYARESEDGKTIYGAYGPRLFDFRGIDQIENVLTLLRENPGSRRAVVQLFDAADIVQRRQEIPCTCTLQFMIRSGRLHMLTSMRSNDAFWGLPHDVFAFTMLQEYIARSLSVELGSYKHAVGSLHLYTDHIDGARRFLREGWQEDSPMPAMPSAALRPSMASLLKVEVAFRRNKSFDIDRLSLDDYWADLARLLQIYRLSKNKERKQISKVKNKMSTRIYHIYIDSRNRRPNAPLPDPQQLLIPAL